MKKGPGAVDNDGIVLHIEEQPDTGGIKDQL